MARIGRFAGASRSSMRIVNPGRGLAKEMKRLLILGFVLGACSLSAFAQNQVEPPLITVTGQAEVLVAPDEAVFALAVENVDKDMIAANRRTDDSVKQILAIAKRHNIKSEDVQTSRVSIQP